MITKEIKHDTVEPPLKLVRKQWQSETNNCACRSFVNKAHDLSGKLAKGMHWLVRFIKTTDKTSAVCDSEGKYNAI